MLNSPGTIDAGYRGELAVVLINHGKKPFEIAQGMRIAQLVFAPVAKVKFEIVQKLLHTSHRGKRGFGSSG